jgi:plasmid stability protein
MYLACMSTNKRATIYLDPELHRALRMKAAETDTSMSELVNEALRQSLADDADDLASFRSRSKEADMDFEEFVSALRQRGKL